MVEHDISWYVKHGACVLCERQKKWEEYQQQEIPTFGYHALSDAPSVVSPSRKLMLQATPVASRDTMQSQHVV